MKKQIICVVLLTVLSLIACDTKLKEQTGTVNAASLTTAIDDNIDSLLHNSEKLIIEKITDHVYLHTSFLNTESFGRVPCNGMIVVNGDEAVVFDTPTDHESSKELIRFINEKISKNLVGVVATHFHSDCVGGLETFHQNKISSYASDRTIKLLKNKESDNLIPTNSFGDLLELAVGDKKVYAEFFGAGHTMDNVIGYFPHQDVIFGGCLIKEVGAGKGNLEDADVKEWSETVRKIKTRHPNLTTVIPGHGKPGGTELLDYTIEMFE